MSTVTPEQLLAAQQARDRPDPARPRTFWGVVWGAPVVAVLLMAPFVLNAAPLPSTVEARVWPALGIVTLLVLGGELVPLLSGRREDPMGVAWSTPFAFAALLYADVVVAAVLYCGATVVNGLLTRKAAYRWAFNAAQYALSLLAAERVLAGFGIHASVADPWAPTSMRDLLACLMAAIAFFVVNEVLVAAVVGALEGRTLRAELTGSLRFEAAVNGSQLLLGPLVAVVMLHAPLLTALAVVPVAAVQRSAAGSLESRRAAAHDHLTGLPNRGHFNHVLQQSVRRAVEGARLGTGGLALFVLDLDRFKDVNDVLGHPVGDRALCEVAVRLRAAVPQAEVIARLSGDEFAFLVEDVRDPAVALEIAGRVGRALGEPFPQPSGHLIDLDASIGIALAPVHGTDVDTLFSRADIAMYQAKRNSTVAAVFSVPEGPVAVTRLGVITSLRRALDRGELLLHFQPKVELRTGGLAGVEALVRWHHPGGEMVSPDDFIPVAEQSGLMPRLTANVLDMALAQCSAWRSAGRHVPVAVNVSLRDMLQDGFTHSIATALLRHDLPPAMLTLEVTERVLAGDLAQVRATMLELQSLGVHLSMDDFGTGWASLQLLRQLPVDEVKLDRTFVTGALDSATDLAIVAMVTRLAHELGMTVVAEGVESREVFDRLAALGCDQAQGWHVARPMPAEDLPTFWDGAPLSAGLGAPGGGPATGRGGGEPSL